MEQNRPFVLDPAGGDIQKEIAALRENGPVTLVELPGGVRAWSVTSSELLKAVLVSPEVSKDPNLHWPAFRDGDIADSWPLANWVNTRSMFTAFGEDHRRLRQVIAPAFTHRRTAALEGRIKDITRELLDGLSSTPTGAVVDLRQTFAYPLPIRVITALLGVPEHLTRPLLACVDGVFDTAATPEQSMATYTTMIELLNNVVAHRRQHPGEDMTSTLLAAADDPDVQFTNEEVVGSLYLVVNAGHETTASLLVHAIHLLLTHPQHRQDVLADESNWPEVIEETLRYQSPAAHVPLRYAVTDLDLGGVHIRAGDPILVCFAAAGRDPNVHNNAETFDPRRPGHEHLAFGFGVHHCLGAPLARLEARIALAAIFKRFPKMELASSDLGTVPGFISNGLARLPVRLY